MAELFSALALFCEDIREEIGGAYTLVGLLPDTINIAPPPAASSPSEQAAPAKTAPPTRPNRTLSRLCILTRINFDPDSEYDSLQVRITMPNGMVRVLEEIPQTTMAQARAQVRNSGHIVVGIISRHIFNGFQVGRPGLLKVEVLRDGKSTLAGALNFRASGDNHEYAVSTSLH